jgi:tetratricopeptide (TPR) repeat protein
VISTCHLVATIIGWRFRLISLLDSQAAQKTGLVTMKLIRTVTFPVFAWAFLVVPSLVLGFGFSADPLKEAQVCLENGSFEKALNLLNEELKNHPKNEVALVLRGEVFFGLNKYQESIQDFSAALEINPGSKKALFGRAVSRFTIHREAESIADLKILLEKDPNDFKARVWIAKCHIDIKQLNEALVHINNALEINKDFQDPYMLRAQINLINKDFLSVIEDTSQAMSLTKKLDDYYNPFRERGAAYVYLNMPDLAIIDLKKAIEKNKKDFAIFDYLCSAYCLKEQFDNGIEAISVAIDLDNTSPYLLLRRVNLYQKNGEYKKAIADLEKMRKISVVNVTYFLSKGGLNERAGLFKDAISDYSEGINLEPNLASLYVSRARVFERIGDFEKAHNDLIKAAEIEPNNYLIQLLIGELHLKNRQFDMAVKSFSKCIEINPKKPEAFFSRFNAYKFLGNDQKAFADLQEVRKLNSFPETTQTN